MDPFFPYKTEETHSASRKILISDYNQMLVKYQSELKSFEAARRALVKREADLENLRNAIEMINE